MTLSHQDLQQLCNVAINAATKAGLLITEYAHLSYRTNRKEAGNTEASQIVTEVDVKSQGIILDILQPTINQFDLALLTEESPDDGSRSVKDYFWCIDPLDGTLSFTQSKPGFSVSIALVDKAGTPLIGVVYDPTEQILYQAIKGQGARRNGVPWQMSLPNAYPGKKLTLVIDPGFTKHPLYANVTAGMEKKALQMGYHGLHIMPFGGAVLNACMVLEQAPALYFKLPKTETGGGSIWDFAATACMFTEMQAACSDAYGHPLNLNKMGSAFMNQKGVLYASHRILTNAFAEQLHEQ